MVEVKYYETVSARKNNEVLGVFNINIVPETIPEVDEELIGKKATDGTDIYELEVARREKKVEKAILDCKSRAMEKVREIVGESGVLVANIVESEESGESV